MKGDGLADRASGSNPAEVGSTPTPPATTYIDNATGQQVGESWWPGDSVPTQMDRIEGLLGAILEALERGDGEAPEPGYRGPDLTMLDGSHLG